MRQWLRAKHIALWTFVGPPCAVVALMIGIARGEFMNGLAVALLLLTLPLGVLSVAAWVGIWLPYRPRRSPGVGGIEPTGAERAFGGGSSLFCPTWLCR